MIFVAYEDGGGATICEACGRYVEFQEGNGNRLKVHQRWKNDKAKRKCRFSGIEWWEMKKVCKTTQNSR
jgi:hypothetical protein